MSVGQDFFAVSALAQQICAGAKWENRAKGQVPSGAVFLLVPLSGWVKVTGVEAWFIFLSDFGGVREAGFGSTYATFPVCVMLAQSW